MKKRGLFKCKMWARVFPTGHIELRATKSEALRYHADSVAKLISVTVTEIQPKVGRSKK